MRATTMSLVFGLLLSWALPAHADNAVPQWNPYTTTCENAPQIVDPAATQCGRDCFGLSAPRQVAGRTRAGDVVELGLWDRSLNPGDGHAVARITAPDGTTATVARDGYGSGWLSLHYPTDFAGAGSTGAGVYTVVWETRGLAICDGFKVEAS
jgi:hypothetical protein